MRSELEDLSYVKSARRIRERRCDKRAIGSAQSLGVFGRLDCERGDFGVIRLSVIADIGFVPARQPSRACDSSISGSARSAYDRQPSASVTEAL